MKPSDVLVVGPNVGNNAANSEVPRTCAEPVVSVLGETPIAYFIVVPVTIVNTELIPAALPVTVTRPVSLIRKSRPSCNQRTVYLVMISFFICSKEVV